MSKKTPNPEPGTPATQPPAAAAPDKPRQHCLAQLRCLTTTKAPHRSIDAGEVFAVIQFRNDADRRHFRANLRWSNFALQDLPPDQG